MTAAELIEEAREHHESFVAARHLEQTLRRELQRAELRFYHHLAQVAEGAVALETVFTAANIATALTGSPLTVPSYIKILSLLVARHGAIYAVAIGQDERADGFGVFRARLIGRNLYLTQPTAFQAQMPADMVTALTKSSPFKEADALRLTYVPLPAALTSPTQVLTAPDEARNYFVGCLVEFMARRSGSDALGVQERLELLELAGGDKAAVLDAFAARSANETGWHVSMVGN